MIVNVVVASPPSVKVVVPDSIYARVYFARGDVGPTGLTGATGAAGTNGTNGAAATLEAGTVTGLAAGSTPTVTNSGNSSAATFNFGIPAGATGSAATIAVGTVTGLSAGATPTVVNGGSSSAATFNFGIPAGATGATGDTGPTGISAGGLLARDYISGNWYTTPYTGIALSTPAQNVAYAIPFYATKNQTFTKLAVNVTTAKSDVVFTLACYDAYSSGQPNALLASGTVTGSVTGIRSVTGLSISVTAGNIYYLVGHASGTDSGVTTGLVMSLLTGNGNSLVHALTQQTTIPTSNGQSFGGTAIGALPNPWTLNSRFAVGIATHIGF